MRTLLAALTALMLFAMPVVAGDSKYGDWTLREILEAADAARASGDHVTEFELIKVFADVGAPFAQSRIGTMYAKGKGDPEDFVQAYAWTSIAAAQGGHEDAKENKGIIKGWMTPNQIAKGQELSSELWEKYVVPFQK